MKKILFCLVIFYAFAGYTLAQYEGTGKKEAVMYIGASAGVVLYDTYTILDHAMEAIKNDSRDSEVILDDLDTQKAVLDAFNTQFSTLLESGFLTDENDLFYCKKISETIDLFHEDIELLRAYVNDPEEETIEAQKKTHAEAWANVAELLDME